MPPGVDSCFRIGPRCIATSDCNQRYGAEPPVVSLWVNAACAHRAAPIINSQTVFSNWCLTFLLHPKEDSPLSATRAGWMESSGPKRALSLRSLISDVPEMIYLFIFLIVFLALHAAPSVISCKLWDFSCSPWLSGALQYWPVYVV